MTLVVHRSRIRGTAEELFELHMDARNLPLISPGFPPITLLSEPKRSEPGDLQVIQFGKAPFRSVWHARVTHVIPGRLLEDVQEKGLFRKWRHQHRVRDLGNGEAELTDAVSFRLLPTAIGEFIEYWLVRPVIKLMFVERHRKTRRVLADDDS